MSDQVPRVLYGITQRAPPDALQNIAKKTSTSIDSLATLTISCASRYLYWDVLQYAAECLESSDQTQSLFIAPENTYENWDGSDSSSSDSEGKYWKKGGKLVDGRGPVEKFKPLVPKIFFGLGETQIVWPPVVKEEKEQQGEKKDEEPNDVVSKAENKRSTIYLVHYIVGEPQYIKNSVNNYREILLASADGGDVLRNFPKELVKWYFEKYDTQEEDDAYVFVQYRFKLEDDSWWWIGEGFQEPRPKQSVILAEGQKEAILDDAKKFMDSKRKDWYKRHGMPYRRSYLFWGPPGNGKMSTIRMIASMFRLTCCIISMRKYVISSEHLQGTLSLVPRNALLVIEDIDVLFDDRGNEDDPHMTPVEFIELLEKSVVTESVVTIMTATEIDGIDRALLRDGIDKRFFFGVPTPRQIQDLFLSFYPDAGEEMSRRFSDAVFARPEGHKLRFIGMLQKLFVEHCDSTPEQCIAGLPAFCDTRFPDSIR